ncbi:hypothetical protein QVN42_17585 [Yersinia nurmii]|uniref:Uncharacterized protein n=1 Tax=Yersinia nurmii TaxID=685706 RepID=A0AAW7K2Z1_9GAMM|nr:hypothetical protein [Yersinia nurmii]MDN0089164.1 hypothetical protein [Yersinia nurmii]
MAQSGAIPLLDILRDPDELSAVSGEDRDIKKRGDAGIQVLWASIVNFDNSI